MGTTFVSQSKIQNRKSKIALPLSPVLLGSGERLFGDVDRVQLG